MIACRFPPFSLFKGILALFALTIVVLYIFPAYVTHPDPGNSHQESSFDPPNNVVVSTARNGRVELEKLTYYEGKRIKFAITYFNKGIAPVTFGLENIMANDSMGKGIRIYTEQDFIKEAKDKAASIFHQSYGGFSYDNLVGNLPLNPQQQSIYNNSVEAKAGMVAEEMIGLGAMIPVTRRIPPNTSSSGFVLLSKTPVTIFKITVAGEKYSALFKNE